MADRFNLPERLGFGVSGKREFDLDELEQLHKFLVGEIASHYGAPAAVKARAAAPLTCRPSPPLPSSHGFCGEGAQKTSTHVSLLDCS